MQSLPYITKESQISTFGIIEDVPADGNCFFHAHWRSKCHVENKVLSLNVNEQRKVLYNYASKNWHDILINITNSKGNTLFGKYTRKYFNIKQELFLERKGDTSATKRINTYRLWYEEHILSPIWNATTNFEKGCSQEYYGNVMYHGPIMDFKYRNSIFFIHMQWTQTII